MVKEGELVLKLCKKITQNLTPKDLRLRAYLEFLIEILR